MTRDGCPSGRVRLARVMGRPAAPSLSPRLDGHWLRCSDIDRAYAPLALPPESLERALRALPALSFAGVDLTLPLQEAAAALIDRLAGPAGPG